MNIMLLLIRFSDNRKRKYSLMIEDVVDGDHLAVVERAAAQCVSQNPPVAGSNSYHLTHPISTPAAALFILPISLFSMRIQLLAVSFA